MSRTPLQRRPATSLQPPGTSEGLRNALLFVVMLVAFVTESELTEYVESKLGYRQPYMVLYVAHSAMALVLPLHLLYLRMAAPFPCMAYVRGLSLAVKNHLSTASSKTRMLDDLRSLDFPAKKFFMVSFWCTLGLTIPALLWFAALTLASVSDVTAIWNSNAFWAYVLTVKLQNLRWEPRKIAAVVVAVLGVLVVVYGSETASQESEVTEGPSSPFLGNLFTLIASICYALYQVLYDMHAVPASETDHGRGDSSAPGWQRLSISSLESLSENEEDEAEQSENVVYPPPFGLYANLLTTNIGLLTIVFLWIPIPLLDWFDVEAFSWPTDWKMLLAIIGIAASALCFLASFMVLLGAWGAVVTSVGSLLTIVLVNLADVLFKGGLESLTIWGVTGSGMIVCAFAALTYESFRTRS